MKRIALLIALTSFHASACKLNALPACQGVEKKITIDPKVLASLRDDLNRYQIMLDANVAEPKSRTSCFNNHAAMHFANGLSSPTCPSQLEVITGHIDQLESVAAYVPAKKKDKVKALRELLSKIKADWKKLRG